MSVRQLDEIDLNILKNLQENARISYTDLAEEIGLSVSRCQRRVRSLEEAGVIKAYATLVCQTVLGLPINVFVMVTLDSDVRHNIDAFETAIADWPEVMECYMMTGDADYFLRIVAADLSSYHKFLMEKLTPLACVAGIKSSFALKQVTYRTAIPIDQVSLGEAHDPYSDTGNTKALAMEHNLSGKRRALAERTAVVASNVAKSTLRRR